MFVTSTQDASIPASHACDKALKMHRLRRPQANHEGAQSRPGLSESALELITANLSQPRHDLLQSTTNIAVTILRGAATDFLSVSASEFDAGLDCGQDSSSFPVLFCRPLRRPL